MTNISTAILQGSLLSHGSWSCPGYSLPCKSISAQERGITKPLGRALKYGVDYRPSCTSEMPMYSRHVPLPEGFIWDQNFDKVLSQVEWTDCSIHKPGLRGNYSFCSGSPRLRPEYHGWTASIPPRTRMYIMSVKTWYLHLWSVRSIRVCENGSPSLIFWEIPEF